MRALPFLTLFSLIFTGAAIAELPSASGQIPDVAKLPDQTGDLQDRIGKTGSLILPTGIYRITKPLVFNLEQTRSAIVRPSNGPVTLVMDGPGPAIRITGSHQGTAGPKSFEPATWNERMPIVEAIEILGNHPQADGIELFQTVEAVVSRVSVRWCRHGIRLAERNRNVVISDVHLYENSGIGLYLDNVNLHQINVNNSHISYNRTGGIVVRDGNVRNLHITGCDIEANMPADDTATNSANIMIDVSGTPNTRKFSVAEVAITGCTIQHSSNYSGGQYERLAPGGANIRILGKEVWPVDSVAITGNVISDTEVHIDISHATDVTLSGNTFFAPNPAFLRVRDSKRILVNGNTFNPRQFERPGNLVFERCQDSIISNCTFRALQEEDGAIMLRDCERMNLIGNILTESKSGIRLERCKEIKTENWIVSGLPEGKKLIESDAP